MNRVAPHLAAIALVAVVAALAEGSVALCGACIVLLLGSGGWAVRNRRGAAGQAWSAAATRSTRAIARATGPASTASVVRSLGRVEARSTAVDGRFGAAAVPTVLSASVLGAGGVALGVALSRWVRVALAPVVAVAAVGFVSLQLGEGAPGGYRPRMLLSTFGTSLPDDAPELAAWRAWLHLAWLVTVTVVTGVVAVAGRQGRRPRRPIALAGAEPVAELGAAR